MRFFVSHVGFVYRWFAAKFTRSYHPSGWWASVERSGRKGFQISHLNTLIYDLNSIFNFRVESFPTLLSTH